MVEFWGIFRKNRTCNTYKKHFCFTKGFYVQQFISFNILTIDLTNSSPSYDRFIWQRFLTNRGQKILPLRHDVHGYQGSQNPKGSENNPTMGKESSDLKTAAYDVKISLSWWSRKPKGPENSAKRTPHFLMQMSKEVRNPEKYSILFI